MHAGRRHFARGSSMCMCGEVAVVVEVVEVVEVVDVVVVVVVYR